MSVRVNVDSGTAYGRSQPGFDADLTRVGPGSPMGELLRRYWHPVGLTADACATPGDYEAQVGQGAIALHSEEHLRTSDKGVALLRRMLRAQLEVIAAGGDPIGVEADPARALVRLEAGNYLDA